MQFHKKAWKTNLNMKDKLGNLKAIKTYGVQYDIVPTGRQMYKQDTKRVDCENVHICPNHIYVKLQISHLRDI